MKIVFIFMVLFEQFQIHSENFSEHQTIATVACFMCMLKYEWKIDYYTK